jgi:DNA-binding CsgD family transcriptional regulator
LLTAALGAARNRQASALVVVGEPGIGKSALLERFLSASRAYSVREIRVSGYSSESELPYAGVDRLLTQLPDEVASLDERLRRALAVATGRETGLAPDPHQVGLAVLSVLARVEHVVACIIDDAHLLDQASLAAFAFVGRRVKAEPVSLIFGTRNRDAVLEVLSGIEVVQLRGLNNLAGVELLNANRTATLDPHLALRVVEQLAGHPLAIIDLAKHADAERLALRALSMEPLPPGTLVQGFYRREIDRLPPDSQTFALVAATDTTGEVDVVREAAMVLGVTEDSAAPVEQTGLLELAERVRFRHQLVRQAIYNAASSSSRRRVHEALAAASEKYGHPAAATSHLALASTGPDAAVAARLESLADAAGGRGALLTRAGLLVRSSDLTPPGPERDERRIAAGEAALAAGAAVLTGELLNALDLDVLSALSRGRYFSARAFLALFIGDPVTIPSVAFTFIRAADAFREVSLELEQRALINAFYYVLTTEWATTGISLSQLGERLLAGAGSGDDVLAIVLRGLSAQLLSSYEDAESGVRRALSVAVHADDATLMQLGLFAVPLAMALWEPQTAVSIAGRITATAANLGSLQTLDMTHWTLSTVHIRLLDVASAGRALENVRELRRAIGYPAEHVVNAAYLALTGVSLELVDAAAASILATGFGGAWTMVQAGIATRLVGDGDYQGAYDRLEPVMSSELRHISGMALPDFVEAAVRSGHADVARLAVETMASYEQVTPTPWLTGLLQRSLALVSDDEEAEAAYGSAIQSLTTAGTTGDLARAHLLFGEWLRRRRRRREAREHLTLAIRMFDALHVAPFAKRAREEFAATGGAAPPQAADTDLTARESLIAGLAADGQTNQDIASALFISPNTVDYHLRKVFRKLGITSRRQLADKRNE